MGLIVPGGPSWAHYTDNFSLTAAADAQGTQFLVSPNHTKGIVTQLLPALAHDVEHVRLGFSGMAAAGTNRMVLADIMIDPAGGTNWSVLIPDLAVGCHTAVTYSGATSPAAIPCWLEFPLWIPAGASVGIRAQSSYTSLFYARAYIQTRGGNRNPGSWWCGQRVTALGIDAATSRGVVITPVQQPTFSAWTDIGAVLATDAGAFHVAIQGEGDTSTVNSTYFCQLGANGVAFAPTFIKAISSEETGMSIPAGLVYANIPAGTQLQVCMSMTSIGGQPIDVAAYCVS